MKKLTCTILAITILILIPACSPAPAESEPPIIEPTEVIAEEPAPSPEATENPFGDWLEYRNDDYGFRFLYPADWFGPEIHDTDGFLRIEVGSDQVYPYGTSREEQISTIPDSYFILIQYVENREGRTWDDFINSGWIDTYLALQDMEDGQFILNPRAVATRIGAVERGEFSGLMYLVTVPDNAQTERAYAREVVLFDNELNWLRISGLPSMVQIADEDKWKNDYARVDTAYLETFLILLESIEIE